VVVELIVPEPFRLVALVDWVGVNAAPPVVVAETVPEPVRLVALVEVAALPVIDIPQVPEVPAPVKGAYVAALVAALFTPRLDNSCATVVGKVVPLPNTL
jgi:hypothetical protein